MCHRISTGLYLPNRPRRHEARGSKFFTKRSDLHNEIHGVTHRKTIFNTQFSKLYRYVNLNLTTSHTLRRTVFRYVPCRPDVIRIVLTYKTTNNLHLHARRKGRGGVGERNIRKCAEIELGCGRVSEYVLKIPRSLS